MTPRIAHEQQDVETIFQRLHTLEAEVRQLRQENARLRGLQRAEHSAAEGPGRYSLVSAEQTFIDLETPNTIPPPPTYREIPAVSPRPDHRARNDTPPTHRAPAGPPPALDVGYVNRVDESKLDELPYGLVVLDREGRVLLYNETESRLTGFARSRVTGRNFFREVAPCTAVKEFEGLFKEFVAGRRGRTVFFDFAFYFSAGTQNVTIALAAGRRPGQTNVMMMRR